MCWPRKDSMAIARGGASKGARNAVSRISELIHAGDTPGDRAVASFVFRYPTLVMRYYNMRYPAGWSSYGLTDHEYCARS